MEDFAKTLTEEQKQALLAALTQAENVSEEPQQEEVATNNVSDDFTMTKQNNLQSNSRRVPVQAQQNGWTDTGEHRNVETPEINILVPTGKEAPKFVVVPLIFKFNLLSLPACCLEVPSDSNKSNPFVELIVELSYSTVTASLTKSVSKYPSP